ncbi:histidine kinase [Virgisporangium aliadipatigenens]|uniref:histidine kinase n=1 Tax=Virgisporangium aliadipatigenens TaxID=741659 RepID=A0A8J3YEM5_9ACTN|nr:sensor histidine kinase [Virgisporangium aliadipatigenens]GIJ43729.1 histidine kinase [Virgisporangium aliadipatigenens]
MSTFFARTSLARQLFVLQAAVLASLVIVGAAVAYYDAKSDAEDAARQRVLDLAHATALSSDVVTGLREHDGAGRLQPYAESVRIVSQVDFVVVMTTEGIRYTHPNPARVGGRFIGTFAPAVAGRPVTETYTGTLGPSVRAVVPVFDGGRVTGLVAVGVTTRRIADDLGSQLRMVVVICVAALLIAGAGVGMISRRLHRMTLGLGPAEITGMYEHHDAVLHAMREGLMVFDRAGRLTVVNDEARRLLGLHGDVNGRTAADLGVGGSLGDLLRAGATAHDEIHLTEESVLVVNQSQASRRGRRLGTVTTLRDHTELQALSGELNSVRGFAESLRAQAHESANRLHTVITMVELGRTDDALAFATEELATTQQLADELQSAVGEPVLVALLLGKVAEASERGVELSVSGDTAMAQLPIPARDLVTLLGNLVDNAIEAAIAAPPPRRVTVRLRQDDSGLLIRVADSGAGLAPEQVDNAFARGWSTKLDDRPHGRGLGLALVRQVLHRHGGVIDVTNDHGAVFVVRFPAHSTVAHGVG